MKVLPKPPLPKHCFDPDKGAVCPFEQIDQSDIEEEKSWCLFYKRQLDIDDQFSPFRCEPCLEGLSE